MKKEKVINISKRNIEIDELKTITIILVVIGHIVQYVWEPENFVNNRVFRFIYSFHMPLFMFISGYVSFFGEKKLDIKKLCKRFISLMTPYIVWLILRIIITRGNFSVSAFINVMINVLKSPDYGLWFLWVLSLNYVFYFIALKLINYIYGILQDKKFLIKIVVFICVIIVIKVVNRITSYFGLGLCSWHIIFFLSGNVAADLKVLEHKSSYKILSGKIILYLGLVWFWRFNARPDFVEYMDFLPMMIVKIICLLYTYIIPFLGIDCMLGIVKCFPNLMPDRLRKIGLYTLQIYPELFTPT